MKTHQEDSLILQTTRIPTRFWLTNRLNSLSEREKLISTVIFFAVVQYIIRLGCMHAYGFHQDELLYMSLGNHLDWGFKETPPFIALAIVFAKYFIGDSVFDMHVLPSLAASLIIFFTGLITIKMGGKIWAVILACAGIAFSSAFLATGSLFIPQVFDELCWILAAYLLISWYKSPKTKYLLLLGIVFGIGMMVKYTMALYGIGLIVGLVMFPDTRKIFAQRAFWAALLIAFGICLPNLLWQTIHSFPAITHYQELRSTQLIYISRVDFLIQQLFVNGTGAVLWIGGFILIFKAPKFQSYRFLAIAFAFVIIVLVALNGKSYYAFGAYPPLFAAGGIFYERYFVKVATRTRRIFFSLLLIPNLLLMIIVLPYLPIEKASKVFEWVYIHLHIHFPLKWEDQKIHNMNQNYADMIGWDELAYKTSAFYTTLSHDQQRNTIVYANNYGEAGAIDYYKKEVKLPPLISLTSSYAIWAPPTLRAKNMIYISDKVPPLNIAASITKVNEIRNPYSRVKGLDIYFLVDINPAYKQEYRAQWLRKR